MTFSRLFKKRTILTAHRCPHIQALCLVRFAGITCSSWNSIEGILNGAWSVSALLIVHLSWKVPLFFSHEAAEIGLQLAGAINNCLS